MFLICLKPAVFGACSKMYLGSVFEIRRFNGVNKKMNKIHTKVKRKFGLPTHIRQYRFFHPTDADHRPKSFASEELAKKWAGDQGLKAGEYSLKRVKRDKRFEVVVTPKSAKKAK